MFSGRYKVSYWDGNAWRTARFESQEDAIQDAKETVGPQGYHESEVVDSETGETLFMTSRD